MIRTRGNRESRHAYWEEKRFQVWYVEQTTLKSSTPITQVYQTCKTVTTTLYKSKNAENKSRNNWQKNTRDKKVDPKNEAVLFAWSANCLYSPNKYQDFGNPKLYTLRSLKHY